MNWPAISRRQMIAVSTSGICTLGGCSALNSGSEPGQDKYRLGHIQLENTLPNPHSVGLRVERDGEQVHEQTYQLDGAPEEGVENSQVPVEQFGCRLGIYDLSIRVDNGDWSTTRIDSADGGQPIEIEVNNHSGSPTAMINVSATEPNWSCNDTNTE